MLEILKSKKVNSIILSFAFAFSICIFAPLEFYFSNVFDFWFTLDHILLIILLTSGLVFGILFLILYFTKGKTHNIIVKIIWILMLCLYIQGNYLNVGYGTLDGTEIDWSTMIGKGIANTLVWIALIGTLFFIKPLKDEKKLKISSSLTSLFLIAIQIVTIIVVSSMAYLNSGDVDTTFNSSFYLDTSKMLEVSEKENIIVFISDTFEATYMNNILEKHPEYKTKLENFTYFDNVTGPSLMTYSSMPTILTGETCQVGKNLKQNIKYCFDNTELYDVLINNGYDIELYTDMNLIPKEDNGIISNKIEKELVIDNSSKIKLTSLLYECVLYKYLPHFLKTNFVVDTSDFSKVSSQKVNQYFTDDVSFNNKVVKNGIQKNNEKNKFQLYYLNGVHTPYIVNEDIEYNISKEYLSISSDIRREKQTIASLNLFLNYINELKKSGAYDNSTIIFLADHGWENRYHINFLIKEANSNSDFSVSHAPVSITEDFIPTILNTATKSKNFGKDIWDYSENENRERKIYNYTFTRGDNTYNVLSKVTISTNGEANDMEKYYISDAEYINSDKVPKSKYKFGENINILKNKNSKYIVLEGFLEQDIRTISKGTNIGKDAKIKIIPKKSETDIEAFISFERIYYDNQKIIITVNDNILLETILNKSDKDAVLNLQIPKDVWNSSEILEIDFSFPNGKLGDPSALGEETLFMSVVLKEILFNN